MSNLGKLTLYLETDASEVVRGLKTAEVAADKFQHQIKKLSDELKAFENQAEKAGKAMQHAFKSGDITGHGRKVTDAVKSYADAAGGAAGSTGLLSSSWAQAGASAFIFLGVLHRVSAVLGEVFELVESSARTAMAEQFFLNAGKSVEEYRQATGGLISDAQLMKRANLADSMGISEETFKSLANVAHAASLKTGQSFDYMFNSIIVGTARSSRLLLDNLGIIVSVKTANERYADAIGKTVEQLTDYEKKQAFANEVARQSSGMMDEYNAITDKSADNFDRLKAAIEDFRTELGRLGSAASGPIGTVAAGLKEIANQMAAIRKFGNTQTVQDSVKGGAQGLLGGLLASIALPGIGSALIAPGAVAGGFSAAADSAEQNELAAKAEFGALMKFLKDEGLDLRDALDIDTSSMRALGPGVAESIKRFQELNKALDNLIKPLEKPKPDDDRGGDDKGTTKSDPRRPVDDIFAGMDGRLRGLAEAEKLRLDAIKERAKLDVDYWDSVADANAKAREEWEKYQAEMDAAMQKRIADEKKFAEDRTLDIIGASASLSQGDVSGLASAAGGALGLAFGSPAIGAAIGGALGPLLEKIQPLVDGALMVAEGFERIVVLGLGPLWEVMRPLADVYLEVLTAIGLLLSSALRPLLPVLEIVITLMSVVGRLLAGLMVALGPVIEAFMTLSFVMFNLIFTVVGMLMGVDDPADAFNNFLVNVRNLSSAILDVAIWLNNVIVGTVRAIGTWFENTIGDDFGLSDFGKELSRADFAMDQEDATVDNTNATKDNTAAVRDLTREFRNLPQGYKVNYAIYQTQDALIDDRGYFGSVRSPYRNRL